MSKFRQSFKASLCLLAFILPSKTALTHPHVFAEARLEVETANKEIKELRHVWRFDELFSSSVLIDFDENRNLELDKAELVKIGSIVKQSLAEFDYYTTVSLDGQPIEMLPPEEIIADYSDNQLLLIFAHKPKNPLLLTGIISAGVYDPTFYTTLDFLNDSDMKITGSSSGLCTNKVVRPDTDEVIAQNEQSLTEAFYDDEENNDWSKLFATRVELTCP